MIPKEDIYHYSRQLATVINRIQMSDIPEDNKTAILEFYHDHLIQGYSQARKIKYLNTLKAISVQLDKSFQSITRQTIAEWLQKLDSTDYSDWTKRDYKVILKIFVRWLKRSDTYPSEVAWIKANKAKNGTLPEQLLTTEEVTRLTEAASHPRDKALISILYESGCRIGEVLSSQIRNVQFDEHGAVLLVNGKTGQRRVRVIASCRNLAQWLDIHPAVHDPNAPLWINLGSKRKIALSYAAAKSILKDIASQAGIKKRIYPHLFRHSRATHLANHLTEAQLKQLFGWVQGSDVASTYVHLSGRDIDQALLKINGIEVEKEAEEVKGKSTTCPRCRHQNHLSAKFCNSCGIALDTYNVMELDEVQKKATELVALLVQHPKTLNTIAESIHRLSPEIYRE